MDALGVGWYSGHGQLSHVGYCTNSPNGTVIMPVPMLIFEGKL